ncbi:VTT domain-containing protein [Desulfonatronospira sp.]|uniref:TVP38/TMEM64 family protein n=1 Tax=Desulfonatronospira sp. TaxID=1962951 RepID=UPI0025B9924F|nr:VTT domain-containing protein [Desulfonatronospira sp.]
MYYRGSIKIIILAGILFVGLLLQQSGVIDISREIARAENLAQLWWSPLLFIILMAVLYTMAMPAAFFIWAMGVIYHPWAATIMVVAGGLAGSIGAYYFTGYLSSSLRERFSRTQAFRLLRQNSGFFQLLAMRSLPGFPHALINYSCGILQIPLAAYIYSTILGFAVKGYIYTSAVHQATHYVQESGAQVVSFHTVWPLLLLVLFSLGGLLFQKKFLKNTC